jgi:hypothetical protein
VGVSKRTEEVVAAAYHCYAVDHWGIDSFYLGIGNCSIYLHNLLTKEA